MQYKGTLIFIEVKTRTNVVFGQPEDFVDHRKEAYLIAAADVYLQNNEWEGEVRFDIVAVHIKGSVLKIKHFEDAFWPLQF